MKIVVYDVAAESNGAAVVLKNFYQDAVHCARPDIQWVFLTSFDLVEETEFISVLRFPQVKRSWLHRLWFENKELPHVLAELRPDLLISLQNMPVRGCPCPQYVYLHQSLQYCPKRFSVLRAEEREMAIRQTLIGALIRRNLPMAEHIYVQTRWMLQATSRWIRWPEDRIHVVPVSLNVDEALVQPYAGQTSRVFFYPARAETYKNHEVILEACRRLMAAGEKDFRVVFTVTPEDGRYARRLQLSAKGLPVDFVGTLSYDRVWAYYRVSTLLFPSYLETCGLPLMEARLAGARVIASDMPFSHEALDGYPNAMFFPYEDASALADCMASVLNAPRYVPEIPESVSGAKLLEQMLRTFEEEHP